MQRATALIATALVLATSPAMALDKQGSAHGGAVEGATSGVALSGTAAMGVSIFNPTYAARPDNSGLALIRYALHLDLDLIGRRLSIPLDVNMFSDRLATPGLRIFAPSELDVITGVTSTWRAGPGALEGGVRVEHDRALDRGGYAYEPQGSSSQTYVDARARYLVSWSSLNKDGAEAPWGGDLKGYVTLGWFAVNPTYFARPDNTGLALFRYAAHLEATFWHDLLAVGLDAIFFTDRRADNVVRPSELDLTPEVILRMGKYELHLAYERDMPIDRGGLVQHFLYVLGIVSFDVIAPH
jgi:hypothetical protein